MFDRRPENEKAVGRAWDLAAKLERGDVLEHAALAKAFGVEYQSEAYYRLVQRLGRRLLDERGIKLVNVPLVGYELATAKGQLEQARRRVVQAGRRIRDGHKTVVLLPEQDCSFTELRAKQAFEEKLRADERAMRQDAQRLAFLMRPRDQRPRVMPSDEDGEAVAV